MEAVETKEINTYQSNKFISNENLDALYYPEEQIMHIIWKQRTIGEPYRQAFLDGKEYSKNHPTKYFLSDIRNQGIVGPEDRKWFESVALPGAIESGVIKVGVVFDGNVFKRYYLNLLLQAFGRMGVPMKFFSSTDSAIKWFLDS